MCLRGQGKEGWGQCGGWRGPHLTNEEDVELSTCLSAHGADLPISFQRPTENGSGLCQDQPQ